MNLTAHIIRKDLVHYRWALLVWGLSFLYLAVRPNLAPAGSVAAQDYFQVMALITFAVLCVALIAGFVQDDNPTDSSAHWRTRPISPIRLMSAKLLLLGALFVGLPLLVIWAKNHFGFTASVAYFREYCLIALVLASLTLSFTAAAACTKNVLYCLLLWVGIVFATGTLMDFLNRFSPVLSRPAMARTDALVPGEKQATLALAGPQSGYGVGDRFKGPLR